MLPSSWIKDQSYGTKMALLNIEMGYRLRKSETTNTYELSFN